MASGDEPSDVEIWLFSKWRFPELGVALNHLFSYRIFHYKHLQTIHFYWGFPMETPASLCTRKRWKVIKGAVEFSTSVGLLTSFFAAFDLAQYWSYSQVGGL